MIPRFDVWMCTFNSEKLLPLTLKRIDKVIPASAINKKFIVDDFSTDKTRQTAEKLGWQVYKNKKKGLPNAQQYAFSLVETGYCASFEHDLYLSKDWWPSIPLAVIEHGYDVANGIRVRDAKGFRELDIYDNNHRDIFSEDNTFYSMQAMKHLSQKGSIKRLVDKNVCSMHIRGNSSTCLKHGYFIYRQVNSEPISLHAKCLIKSPLRSIQIFRETMSYPALAVYQLERLMIFTGALSNKLNKRRC
jgi:glycosyltransferase involved in cell wall biosynthesis